MVDLFWLTDIRTTTTSQPAISKCFKYGWLTSYEREILMLVGFELERSRLLSEFLLCTAFRTVTLLPLPVSSCSLITSAWQTPVCQVSDRSTPSWSAVDRKITASNRSLIGQLTYCYVIYQKMSMHFNQI